MLSCPDSARLIFVGDQPMPLETWPPVRLPRSRRSSAASRLRRTVGLPDGAISPSLLLRLRTRTVCRLPSLKQGDPSVVFPNVTPRVSTKLLPGSIRQQTRLSIATELSHVGKPACQHSWVFECPADGSVLRCQPHGRPSSGARIDGMAAVSYGDSLIDERSCSGHKARPCSGNRRLACGRSCVGGSGRRLAVFALVT